MEVFGMHLTPWQITAVVLGAFITGFSKTGIIGSGIILTPLIASTFPAGTALGFVVPLSIASDLVTMARYRHKVMVKPLMKALPWGLLGTVGGWWIAGAIGQTYGNAADAYLRTLIGVLMGVVVALGFYVARNPDIAMGKRRDGDDADNPEQPKVKTWYAAALGTFAGMVSMLTNSGGPIWGVYLSSLGLEVKEIIGTVVWCYFIVALLKVPLSANLGFLDGNTLRLNAILLPITILGVFVGGTMSGKFSKKTFGVIIRVLAALGSLYMILF